jgi:hypothetical protein
MTCFLVTTADLLLARTASVTVFARFCGGSSGMGVELAGWEVIMACAGAGAVLTTAVVTAATAITSPPMLTIGRGKVRKWLRLLSAHASLSLLSCVRLLSLADRRPGWREEGGGIFLRKKVNFSILPRAFYSTCAQTPLSTHS